LQYSLGLGLAEAATFTLRPHEEAQTCMSESIRLLKYDREQAPEAGGASPSAGELAHFRSVTSSVMQDALGLWADVWAELQDGVAHGVAIGPEAEKGFRPSCGWSEFLEKLWLLRHHLDFMDRFSRQ
jgi:hypothetical protein